MPDNPSLLSVLLSRATSPLTTAPTDLSNQAATAITTPHLGESPMAARLKGFGAGALQGVGKLASGMTSPLSLALLGAGPIAKGLGAGAGAIGEAAGPAAETLGEVSPEFTPQGGEGMYNAAKAYTRYTDPQETAYQAILARGGR